MAVLRTAKRLWRFLYKKHKVRNEFFEMSYLVGMAGVIKAVVLQEVGGRGPVKVP